MVVSKALVCQTLSKLEKEFGLPGIIEETKKRFLVQRVLLTIIPILSLISGIFCFKTGVDYIREGKNTNDRARSKIAVAFIGGIFLTLGLGLLLMIFMTCISLGRQLAKSRENHLSVSAKAGKSALSLKIKLPDFK